MVDSAQYAAELVECFRCGGVRPRAELCAIDELPGFRWPRYCYPCAEEIRAAHARRCLLCGAPYLARLPADPDSLCLACSTPSRLRELARVRYHLGRAAALSLPATLTLSQWLAAIEHFAGRCAYCDTVSFTDLDHFVPLSAGGGTTAANCVPACGRCNTLKRGLDPTAARWDWPGAGAVARIAVYLGLQP